MLCHYNLYDSCSAIWLVDIKKIKYKEQNNTCRNCFKNVHCACAYLFEYCDIFMPHRHSY